MTEKNIRWTAEIVTGQCPTCNEFTSLVGINNTFFRCTNCGEDLEQKVNGVIKYVVSKDLDSRPPYVKEKESI